MKLSFGNMTLEMNIFNIYKQLGDDNDLQEVDFIKELVYDQLESTLSKIELDESEDLQMIYSQKEITDEKGTENVDADLLSRVTTDSTFDITPVDDYFPIESLLSLSSMPWFAKNINFLASGFLPAYWSTEDKRNFLSDVQKFYWDALTYSNIVLIKYFKDAFLTMRQVVSLDFVILRHVGVISRKKKMTAKILQCGFYWPTMFKDTHVFCKACENCQKSGFTSKHKESLDNLLLTFETYPSGDVNRVIHDL